MSFPTLSRVSAPTFLHYLGVYSLGTNQDYPLQIKILLYISDMSSIRLVYLVYAECCSAVYAFPFYPRPALDAIDMIIQSMTNLTIVHVHANHCVSTSSFSHGIPLTQALPLLRLTLPKHIDASLHTRTLQFLLVQRLAPTIAPDQLIILRQIRQHLANIALKQPLRRSEVQLVENTGVAVQPCTQQQQMEQTQIV